jgi:PKHD-type hydroxylase
MNVSRKFLRSHRTNIDHFNYYYFENGFTPEECDKIIELASALPKQKGTTVGDSEEVVSEYRKSEISWIPQTEEYAWLYDKITNMSQIANSQMWNYDIWGYDDDLQFTRYYDDGGHYDWHADLGAGISNRKLSCVIQLSEPSDYEGGDLQLNPGGGVTTIPKKKGQVTFFSSFVLHRVTPVVSGTRMSLVTWLAGANLR